MEYKDVQMIAEKTIQDIRQTIHPGMTLLQVRNECEQTMLKYGADSFWYYDIGAFVFSGKDTTVSLSGREYTTADKIIETDDIITIDLSPQCGNIWGDYARTIVLEKGVVRETEQIENREWRDGLLMEDLLHQHLYSVVHEDTTFEQLYETMNRFIIDHGYINLDCRGNLGHSIVKHRDDRIYIEKGNDVRLSDVSYFTFEPHIARPCSCYGFKKENIYCLNHGMLKEL